MADSSKFYCPHCGRKYRWKAEVAGRKLRCFCQARIRCPKFRQNSGTAELIEPPPGGSAPPASPGDTAFHYARPKDDDNAMDRTYTAMNAVAWGAFAGDEDQDDDRDDNEGSGDVAASDEAWGASASAIEINQPQPASPRSNPLDDSDHGESALEDMLFANAGSGGGELSIPSDESGEHPQAASDAGGNPLDEILFTGGDGGREFEADDYAEGSPRARGAQSAHEANPLAELLASRTKTPPPPPVQDRHTTGRPRPAAATAPPPAPRIGRRQPPTTTDQPDVASDQTVRCPDCGTPSVAGAMVCLNCGSKFERELTINLASLDDLGGPATDGTIDVNIPKIRDGLVDLDAMTQAKKPGLAARFKRSKKTKGAEKAPGNGAEAKGKPAPAPPKAKAPPRPRMAPPYVPSRWRDIFAPLLLMVLAAGVSVADAVFVVNAAGSRVALLAAITMGLALVLQTPMLLMGIVLSARGSSAKPGPPHIALLKLTGVALATLALSLMMVDIFDNSPAGFALGLVMQIAIGLGLVKGLFRFTWVHSLVTAACLLAVNVGVYFALEATLSVLLAGG